MRKLLASLASAAAILVIVGSSATAGEAVTLRTGARVESAQIRLGDLFDNAGEHAADMVATAPVAGNSTLFEAPWLAATARAHGLDWRPPSSFTAIRVDRASVTIENSQIAARLVEAMGKTAGDVRVVLDSQLRLFMAVGETGGIGVENIDVNRDTGRFSALIRLPADDPAAQPVRVAGRVETLVNMPVLARAMAPGDVIRASDVIWTQMVASSLPPGDLLDPKDIIGRTPRHPLRAEQALRPADIQIPLVVKRNELVLIVLERPGLYLTAEGKALEDGGQGSLIRVVNTQSNRTIDAVVVGSGRVAAQMTGIQQASAF
jgi:flagella basal body P-ring formation protein FlgA